MPVLDHPISKEDWLQEVNTRIGVPAVQEKQSLAAAGAWEPTVQKLIGFQQLDDDWDG